MKAALFLCQDDLKDQAQELEQRLTTAEAEKSRTLAELQDLQQQLSQSQEGEVLRRREKGGEPRNGRRIYPQPFFTTQPHTNTYAIFYSLWPLRAILGEGIRENSCNEPGKAAGQTSISFSAGAQKL